MTKYIVTLPSLPGKYIEVESRDRITAALDALGITVWSEEEWEEAKQCIKQLSPENEFQRVDIKGQPV